MYLFHDTFRLSNASISEIVFGLCHHRKRLNKNWLPGWRDPSLPQRSWAYHGDTGELCASSAPYFVTTPIIGKYGFEDTLGCAVDFEKGSVFFTKNGKRLMNEAFTGVNGRLHTVVGISEKAVVKTNFTRTGFTWKPGNSLDFEADLVAETPEPPKLQKRATFFG